MSGVYVTRFNTDQKTRVKLTREDYSAAGFYFIDINRLLKGKLERHKMSSAIGGASNFIDTSTFSDRFAFVQNYSQITVIPFPHCNMIELIGMEQKTEYLIWREKAGFFTALDRKSNLKTWSLLTGKLLYSEI